MSASLTISLVAYHAVGNLVFVKVPSERGRWMLTDMCVIVVECGQCGAGVGEPCRSSWSAPMRQFNPTSHSTTTHVSRRYDADHKMGRGWKRRMVHRLRIAPADIEAARAVDFEPPAPEEIPDIDFEVTPK